MGRLPPAARRPGATLVAIALLAGSGPIACGTTRPSPTAPRAEMATQPAPHLLLRLGERRLYVVDGTPGGPVVSFPIAVGRKGLETPSGRFEVEEMVEHPDFLKFDGEPPRVVKRIPPGPWNPLGERWIGFAHGEGWTIGIHGTPNPELLGQAVSHGCVRMRNADVLRVYDRVKLGTTVIVEP